MKQFQHSFKLIVTLSASAIFLLTAFLGILKSPSGFSTTVSTSIFCLWSFPTGVTKCCFNSTQDAEKPLLNVQVTFEQLHLEDSRIVPVMLLFQYEISSSFLDVQLAVSFQFLPVSFQFFRGKKNKISLNPAPSYSLTIC